MMCPMKISALSNPHIGGSLNNPDMIDLFLECNKEQCAWYCQYPNSKGECAIHSLPGLFDGLQDIAGTINRK